MPEEKPERTLGYPKWEKWTMAMNKVFNHKHSVGYAIIFTDEELVDLVNEELDEEDRISYRTFKRYKAGEMEDDGILSLFVSLYKKALLAQKANLQQGLIDDVPGGWQRYAWILERKFDEWNLRAKSVDETPDVGRLVFRVTSEEEKE